MAVSDVVAQRGNVEITSKRLIKHDGFVME